MSIASEFSNSKDVTGACIRRQQMDGYGLMFEPAPTEPTAYEVEQGRRLTEQLDAKWYGEGYGLFLLGVPLAACWSARHRRGWLDAQAARESVLAEVEAKPWLGVEVR